MSKWLAMVKKCVYIAWKIFDIFIEPSKPSVHKSIFVDPDADFATRSDNIYGTDIRWNSDKL